MTTFNRSLRRRAGSLPFAPLAPVLVASLLLMTAPPRATEPLKGAVSALFAPGQRWATRVRRRAFRWVIRCRLGLATAAQQQDLSDELQRLRQRNEELETALALAARRDQSEEDAEGASSPSAPLVRPALVQARVLGPQARAFLERLDLLDAGRDAGLEPDALVFEASTVVLDQGRNAEFSVDDLALAGRRIVGKLVDVGPQTSVVRKVTDPGYRDLVQLAQPSDEGLRLGARGVLEGAGESLCRIRMVEVTEPVATGDLVLAAGETGASSFGAVYGRVARVERRPGDVHWRIWMEPAAGQDSPGEVAVLRLQTNPERIARAQDEVGSP